MPILREEPYPRDCHHTDNHAEDEPKHHRHPRPLGSASISLVDAPNRLRDGQSTFGAYAVEREALERVAALVAVHEEG